jgi:hypothetical protein
MAKRINEERVMMLIKNMGSFDTVIREIREIRYRKNTDYGNAFMKFYDDFGMMAVVCDLGRKYGRIQNFAKGKDLKVSDETVEDTLKDIAIIALNAVCWLRERKAHGIRKVSNGVKEVGSIRTR